jgi:predicted RNase H-like HicB family nuclease
MDHYAIIVYWSDEDALWIAEAPDLEPCAAHGRTPEEAVAELRVAMEGWLAVAPRKQLSDSRATLPAKGGSRRVVERCPQLGRVFVVGRCAGRQLHPRVPVAVIDRIPGRRIAPVGEGPYGDGHRRLFATLFGVEQVCPADRAESNPELGALVANANILGCGAGNLVGSGEGGECGKHAARPALTGKAVANADPERSP